MDIREMEAGRELDALVAEKVMGLNVVSHDWSCGRDPECGYYEASCFPDDESLSWYSEKGPVYTGEFSTWPPEDQKTGNGRFAVVIHVPFYSTDISAAWEVIEKMNCPYIIASTEDGEQSWVHFGNEAHAAIGETPHAICIAALLAKEESQCLTSTTE